MGGDGGAREWGVSLEYGHGGDGSCADGFGNGDDGGGEDAARAKASGIDEGSDDVDEMMMWMK